MLGRVEIVMVVVQWRVESVMVTVVVWCRW